MLGCSAGIRRKEWDGMKVDYSQFGTFRRKILTGSSEQSHTKCSGFSCFYSCEHGPESTKNYACTWLCKQNKFPLPVHLKLIRLQGDSAQSIELITCHWRFSQMDLRVAATVSWAESPPPSTPSAGFVLLGKILSIIRGGEVSHLLVWLFRHQEFSFSF